MHAEAEAASTPRAVVGDRGQVELHFDRHAPGFESALEALAEAGVDAPFTTSGDAVCVRVRRREAPDWPRLAEELVGTHGAELREGTSTVTVVGGARAEVARAVRELVPQAAGLACDEGVLRVMLPEAHVDEAVRALHARLVTEAKLEDTP